MCTSQGCGLDKANFFDANGNVTLEAQSAMQSIKHLTDAQKRKYSSNRIIVRFKIRPLTKDQHPTNYEALQVAIEAIILERYFEYNHEVSSSIG